MLEAKKKKNCREQNEKEGSEGDPGLFMITWTLFFLSLLEQPHSRTFDIKMKENEETQDADSKKRRRREQEETDSFFKTFFKNNVKRYIEKTEKLMLPTNVGFVIREFGSKTKKRKERRKMTPRSGWRRTWTKTKHKNKKKPHKTTQNAKKLREMQNQEISFRQNLKGIVLLKTREKWNERKTRGYIQQPKWSRDIM